MDIKVLIPRTRRALDGPTATSSAAVGATLNDNQIKGLVADAIAEVIWYAPEWQRQLVATSTDPDYGAPDEWSVTPDLSEPEQTVIVTQAALNFFWQQFRNLKVAETIVNEASTWTYQLSANLLVEQFKHLVATRDTALQRILAVNPVIGEYISFLELRDARTASLIEPWVNGPGIPSGQEIPQDSRFGVW